MGFLSALHRLELVMQQVSEVVPIAPNTLKAFEFFALRGRKTGNECRPLTPIVDEMRYKPIARQAAKPMKNPVQNMRYSRLKRREYHVALRGQYCGALVRRIAIYCRAQS